MEPRKHKLDQWLDQALSDYGHAEPRLGLESRILGNLAVEKSRINKRVRWPWTFASAATVLAVVAVIWAWMSTQKAHKPSINFANNNTVLQKQPMVTAQAEVQVLKASNGQRTLRQQFRKAPTLAKSPRLSQFPSVRELSTQEQLLARYAREFPQQALEVAQTQAVAEQERINGELAAE